MSLSDVSTHPITHSPPRNRSPSRFRLGFRRLVGAATAITAETTQESTFICTDDGNIVEKGNELCPSLNFPRLSQPLSPTVRHLENIVADHDSKGLILTQTAALPNNISSVIDDEYNNTTSISTNGGSQTREGHEEHEVLGQENVDLTQSAELERYLLNGQLQLTEESNDDELELRLEVATLISETPSEKFTTEVTRLNTLRNQEIPKVESNNDRLALDAVFFSLRNQQGSTRVELNYKLTPKEQSLQNTNLATTQLSALKFEEFVDFKKKHALMFYYPEHNSTEINHSVAQKWKFWVSKDITSAEPSFAKQLRGYKQSLTHCRDYKSCKASGWTNIQENMELLSDLLMEKTQQPAVTHVLKKGVYPTDIDVFQESITLYLHVERSRVYLLIFALCNIIANDHDYVFYDKDFDINTLRSSVVGLTFLKTLSHITIKIWMTPLKHNKHEKIFANHQRDLKLIKDMCQLLYDASEGQLCKEIVSAMYSDNRFTTETPVVFPEVFMDLQ